MSTIDDHMKLYLKKVLLSSLSHEKDIDDETKDLAIEHLIQLLEQYSLQHYQHHDNINSNHDNEENDDRKRRKVILESCMYVSKSLKSNRTNTKNILESFSTDDINKIFDNNITTTKMNTITFEQITSHHFSLIKQNAMNCDWETSISNYSTLKAYADAANFMGEKDWVVKGNNWMKDIAINFFLKGLAKSSYIKSIKKGYYEKNNRAISKNDLDLLLEPLKDSKDNILSDDSKLVKVIDVGSCYNPFSSINEFDVIALDLCPVEGKPVFHCDFLNLSVGDVGSLPIITSNSIIDNDTHNNNHHEMFNDISQLTKPISEYRLNALPKESADVVCMSLVLSYLPTPLMRLQMVIKAHQLLSAIDPVQNKLRTGILLVIEKDSIFHGSNHNNRFLSLWKQAICNVGFEIIKYEILITECKRSHAFAFKKINNSTMETTNLPSGNSSSLLWIKQDFETDTNINMCDIFDDMKK